MKKLKIGFDVDGTLYDRLDVQEFVKELIQLSYIEVWIVTTRLEDKDNNDIFELAESLGITNIHFTNMKWKFEFYKDEDFLFHVDDLQIEIEYILEKTDTIGFHISDDFRTKGLELIKNHG
jgi:FMN phosphatase YigB (HAD superfamily)